MSGEGNSNVATDDYDDIWIARSARDLRRFMASGVTEEHYDAGKHCKGVTTTKTKLGGKRSGKMSTTCEVEPSNKQHGYDDGFKAGFELFRQYAKYVDPTGGWGSATVATAKSVVPRKMNKGLPPG